MALIGLTSKDKSLKKKLLSYENLRKSYVTKELCYGYEKKSQLRYVKNTIYHVERPHFRTASNLYTKFGF